MNYTFNITLVWLNLKEKRKQIKCLKWFKMVFV